MTRPGTLPLLRYPDDFPINRECAGESEFAFDDQGNEYELCPENDHGHLWFRAEGEPRGYCVHCHCEER